MPGEPLQRLRALLGHVGVDDLEDQVRFTAQTEGVPQAAVLKRLTGRMALPDLATDAGVAGAAVFLASDRARAVMGQSLLVDAGELMRRTAVSSHRRYSYT